MPDSVQPGTEVDAELWERFREEVKRRRGGIRGHLRTEMENALRAYIDGGDATPAQVNRRLERIEAAVGVEATDGGTDTSDATECTHMPDQALDVPDERPHTQGQTKRKVCWLADRVLDAEGVCQSNLSMTHEDTIREVIQTEYDFKPETAEEYIGKVTERLGLVDHPSADVLYVTEEKRDELIEKQREQTREEARDRSENL